MTSLATSLYGLGPTWAVELAASDLPWVHELRDPHTGKWVHSFTDVPGKGIHRYVVPDPERLITTRGIRNPADQSFFKAHPVSPENVIAAYDEADEGTRAQGRDWYRQNHDLAKMITGGNAEEGAILLSAYSPQKPWPYNMFQAMKSARRGKALGPGEGMAITGDNALKAQKAIDGEGIDTLMTTSKQHSFGVLLKQGDDSPDDPYGHVVIDTHALNVAAGGGVRGKAMAKAPISNARMHEYVADQYREAARRISEREGVLMKPHEMQAITWLVQQQRNKVADAWAAEHGTTSERGLIKGRKTMTANAWKKWMAYARAHDLQLVPGVSSLAAQLAALELSLSAQLDLAFNPLQPRGPDGRWVTAGGLPWDRDGDTVRYHGGLGIPREQVPQLSGTIAGTYHGPGEIIPKFTAWLGERGITASRERVPAHSLRPVKAAGSYTTVRGLADEIKSGKRDPDWKPVLASSDGYVLDGTQTWAAKALADSEGGPKPGIPVLRVDAPLEKLLPLARQFTGQIGMPNRKAGEVADPAYRYRKAAAAITHSPEGFSIRAATGKGPDGGFMVAKDGHTHTYPASLLHDREALARAIDRMLTSEREAFGPHTYLGGWVHDGKLWLDPSDHVASRGEAVTAGKARGQVAVWDVAAGQEISTGGSGGTSITEHAWPDAEGDRPGTGGLRGPARGPADESRPGAGPPVSAGIGRQLLLTAGLAAELAFNQAERRDTRGRWTAAGDIPVVTPLLTEAPPGGPASGAARRGAPEVVSMLGAGQSAWSGRSFTWGGDDPGYRRVAAELTWKGDLGMQDALARSVDDPDSHTASGWETLLHELIHSAVPQDQSYSDHEAAYQQPGPAAIEEGFTQLGSYHHAAEFFTRMGIGDRKTLYPATDEFGDPVPNPAYKRKTAALAADMQKQWAKLITRGEMDEESGVLGNMIQDLKRNPAEALRRLVTTPSGDVFRPLARSGDPQLAEWARAMKTRAFRLYRDEPSGRMLTFRELADHYNDPVMISAGQGGWGSYWQQTAAAQEWTRAVAVAEGHDFDAGVKGTPGWKRTTELADEINRVGPRDKPKVMAEQVLRTAALQSPPVRPRPDYYQRVLMHLSYHIAENWQSQKGGYPGIVRELQKVARTFPQWFEGGVSPYQAAS